MKLALTLALALLTVACQPIARPSTPGMVGAWQSRVRFRDGALAGIRDLRFMLVFNAGGTLTESSNYDGAPPVPPAYGIWKSLGGGRYRARYAFFANRPPAHFAAIARGGGWRPDGHGLITENLRLSPDGRRFTATLTYTAYDAAGKRRPGGGQGTATGVRMTF